MSIDRRSAIGFGVLGVSALATGLGVLLRDQPGGRGPGGQGERLNGFASGETTAFLANPKTVEALKRRGLAVKADRAGSLEQVREPRLLGRRPDFLWPSAAPLVDLARKNARVLGDQVVFNSPIVIYTWDSIADGLVKAGLATKEASHYRVDAKALIQAVIDARPWRDLGQGELYGHIQLTASQPAASGGGFGFAGLAANILAGGVANRGALPKALPQVVALFEAMTLKPPSSGQAFGDFIAGGPAAQPLAVGCENQLIEWIMADPDRWRRLQASGAARPVTLYLRPTVYAAHPLIALSQPALPLIDALLSAELQSIGSGDHGFRGPSGQIGADADALVAGNMLAQLGEILPMPDVDTMLALLGALPAVGTAASGA